MKQLRVTVDGKAYEVTVEVLGDSGDAPALRNGNSGALTESTSVAAPQAPAAQKVQPAAQDGSVVSPMSGSIIKVLVKNGDRVSAGQELIILEAMKMETPISAPSDGVVSDLVVSAGMAVEEGQALLKLES